MFLCKLLEVLGCVVAAYLCALFGDLVGAWAMLNSVKDVIYFAYILVFILVVVGAMCWCDFMGRVAMSGAAAEEYTAHAAILFLSVGLGFYAMPFTH